MSVTAQIFKMYYAPLRGVGAQMDAPPREGRIFTYLMAGALLFAAAGAPGQARDAFYDDSIPVDARLYWSAIWWLGLFPIVAYGLAALSHGVLRLLGSGGAAFRARLALFWALLSLAPLTVLTGLTSAFVGPSPILDILVAANWGVGILFWVVGLSAAYDKGSGHGALG